jgi:hypothetical protein
MCKLSRRSLVASAATLPALVVPASATVMPSASGHPDSRLLELERRIVALDAATIQAGIPWDEAEHAMFAWERCNPEPKEKKTEPLKLGHDPDLERAIATYGDQISKTIRDILPILMEPSADTEVSAEYQRELSSWNERRCAASVNCRYEERKDKFERLIAQADALREAAAGIVPNTIDGLRCKARMLSDADLGCVNGALAESIIDELRAWPAAA